MGKFCPRPKVAVVLDQFSSIAPQTPHKRQNGHSSRSLHVGLVPTIVHGPLQPPHRNPPYTQNLLQYRHFCQPISISLLGGAKVDVVPYQFSPIDPLIARGASVRHGGRSSTTMYSSKLKKKHHTSFKKSYGGFAVRV
jgi:hypothetical protein